MWKRPRILNPRFPSSKKARAEGTEADASNGVAPRLYRAGRRAANRKPWKSRRFFDLGRLVAVAPALVDCMSRGALLASQQCICDDLDEPGDFEASRLVEPASPWLAFAVNRR
jgi:hypothetical protein